MILTENVTNFNIGALSVLKIENVENFDTGKVFDCGQCFRFDPVLESQHEVEFAGCAHGKYISIAQDGDTLYVYNATLEDYENIWKRFLGLDRNYGEINRDILSRGENPALADERMRRAHSLQLSYYSDAIKEMFGKRPVRVGVYSLHAGREIDIKL